MELYLQFGHGMMGHCKELLSKWGNGTVILSPRDLKYEQMLKFTKEISKINGCTVFDPQFYVPRANHSTLIKHDYWPGNYSTALFDLNSLLEMLKKIKEDYNDKFNTDFFILPSNFSSEIDEDWFKLQELIIEASLRLNISIPVYVTLCLSSEVIRSEDKIHQLLDYTECWDTVAGYYVVPQPPKNNYLIEDPLWIVNLMDLCAGLKLQKKKVIAGYTNHQYLCLALAKVDAIASGSWLNVRRFDPDKFHIPEEDETSRRSKWYYCPQALSEYQIPFLDMAYKTGILDKMKTDSSFGSSYADILFAGAQPTSVNYPEPNAFRHYLQCLKIQVENAAKNTYEETKQSLKIQIETASNLIDDFKKMGVRGKNRDFSNVADFNQSALDQFDFLRGMILKNSWNDL